MFYDLVLLKHQNQGRFAMAWIASTRGINAVIKKFGLNEIRNINIPALCDETLQYLMSKSTNPRERVSLRMAVHLVEGTIIIFTKKVSIFQEDLFRDFTRISTFSKDIILPGREEVLKKRTFKTPPTPIIKEKRKRKRPVEESILEDFPRDVLDVEASDVFVRPTGVPSDVEARRESLLIQESQLSKIVLPDEVFGEFDVGPTLEFQQIVPPKPPSELSEKSQLERIEEKLIAEEELRRAEEIQTKRTTSSSGDEGPRIIQVEAMVHRDAEETVLEKKSSSDKSSMVEGPKTIEVQVEVHRALEDVESECTREVPQPTALKSAENGATFTTVEQPSGAPEPMDVEDNQSKQPIEQLGKTADKGIQESSILGEKTLVKKRTPLRQLQKDQIPVPGTAVSTRSSKEEKERKRKEEKIQKELIKSKSVKRVLRLDDYKKFVTIIDFPIITGDIVHGDVRDIFMDIPVRSESVGGQFEQMRREEFTPSFGSQIVRKVQTTPLESSSQLQAESSMRIHEAIQSTPFREDIREIPKKLYSQVSLGTEQIPELVVEEPKTFIDEEQIIPQRRREEPIQIISTDQIIPEALEEEPIQIPPPGKITPLRREEDEKRRKYLLTKIEDWDESMGYISIDYLIPEPKNRMNAAKTFFVILTLAKEQLLIPITERNSMEIKFVRRGSKLL